MLLPWTLYCMTPCKPTELCKQLKYGHLAKNFLSIPVVFETSIAVGVRVSAISIQQRNWTIVCIQLLVNLCHVTENICCYWSKAKLQTWIDSSFIFVLLPCMYAYYYWKKNRPSMCFVWLCYTSMSPSPVHVLQLLMTYITLSYYYEEAKFSNPKHVIYSASWWWIKPVTYAHQYNW